MKRDVSEIEAGSGFFMGFVNAMRDVVCEKAIPFAAVYRLATAGGRKTLGSMIDLAYADWQAEQSELAEQQPQGGHPYRDGPTNGAAPFSARIIYVLPPLEELERRFLARVNPNYEGKRFDPIECCKGVSTKNREVAFEYVHMDRDALTVEVLAEMDRRGLRPALYEELLGFAEKYPDEQRKYPIVALGSETVVDSDRSVASLSGGGWGGLGLDWVAGSWLDRCRFLAVRK